MHTIINGDSRRMGELDGGSVHLVVTSPPYWQLKDYGAPEQIGFNDSYENYINNLNLVWSECHRVLRGGCRLCVNIGDQFARSTYYGRYKVIPIHSEIIKFCEILGFDFMGKIIWQKTTTMHTSGGGSVMGSFPYPRNGIVKLDYEYVLLFKKQGEAPKPEKWQKDDAAMSVEEWNLYFNGHWNFAGAKQNGHLAMFPEELPRRLIKMFSFPGETVLDPFLGSGTTSLAAKNLGRNSVGYEINPEFIPLIRNKLGTGDLFAESGIVVRKQKTGECDFEKEIAKLPYRFADNHGLDKKTDVKKLQYGSKIDAGSGAREEYFTVREIVSPEVLKLSNNVSVRLIGIRQNPAVNGAAVKFLNDRVAGRRVFLKYDAKKQNDGDGLPVYLYLENKTFVNAHLLKRGLALVDENAEFGLKGKFLKLV